MIRLAKKEDAKDILSLLEEVLLVHNKIRPDLYKEAGSKYDEEELNKIIADERYLIYVCEKDEKVVGHCIVIKEEKKETNSTLPYKSLYIDDLCVKEKYRNKGIATSLYNKVKEYAVNNGYYNLTLHAYNGNEAVEFYKKLGMDVMMYTFEEILKKRSE